jgi:hypothetical protein
MFLLSVTKKGFSSKEIQKQLGPKRYEPVWAMVHISYARLWGIEMLVTHLEGMIEMDEGFFAIEASEFELAKGGKRQRRCGQIKCSNSSRIYTSGGY